MLSEANITTVDAFAELLLSAPTFIANFIRSEAAAAAIAGRYTKVLNAGSTETVLTGDVVDTSTAEAMVADERAHRWLANAELSAGLLKGAEVRTDFA
jgi:hypothetical protein